MRNRLLILVALQALAGCAQQPAGPVAAPPLAVPWAAQIAPPHASPVALGQPSPLSSYLLQNSDYYVARSEKAVFGAYPLLNISAYSDYTYDWQPISTPNASGYRYRSVVRQGVSFP